MIPLFDEASHTYTVDGVAVPSVTQIMGGLRDFAGIPEWVLAAAAVRGDAAHRACALLDLDDLDESTVAPKVAPYLDGWRLFSQREKPEWALVERPLYDPTNRYAGTPDRAGWALDGWGVFEIKTTAQLHPAFGVQLAGYHRLVCVDADFEPATRRYVVQLLPNGKYRVEQYKDPLDEVVFASCLAINHWRRRL